ncbi:MAG: thermonuclease family protein [Lysobacterales bacterium]
MGIPRLAALVFLLCILSPAHAETLVGRVVGVHDGDTLTLLNDQKRQTKVRLAEIDTPESAQPYGSRSKQALSDLVFGKAVQIEVRDIDRYGRTVGRVLVNGTDVNAALVASGAAWVYRQYSKDTQLLALEAEARAAQRGLWALPEALRTPPWEWRRAQREGKAASAASPAPPRPATTGSGFSCSQRKTCGQMASCAEADYHLLQCGNTRLDRNNDGVPCETICR